MSNDFFVRCDGKYTRIDIRDICYIESLDNYVRIVTASKNYMVLISLRQLEEELPSSHFCRIHRSFIVSLSHISSFDHEAVTLVGKEIIPISPVFKHALQGKVRVLVSDTRSQAV